MPIIIAFESTSEVRCSAFLSASFYSPCRIQARYCIAVSNTLLLPKLCNHCTDSSSVLASLGKMVCIAQHSQQSIVFISFTDICGAVFNCETAS